ncbi:MAG: hypothetical protein ACI8UR_001536 [Natronomonas sp.]|jgi:hypothetical protein|uniref:DUF7575 domain-containing protein n=1 Tax=Natronomonas sp. TaxID=2184060 RepID=UPI0039897287
MSTSREKRPIVAALLSFVQPGLGHLYLRSWVRAALWAGLWLGSLATIVLTAGVNLTTVDALAAVFGLFATLETFPIEATLAMFTVTIFATLDAYWLTTRTNHKRRTDVGRCPRCGKDTDPTLDFCHWCTARLDDR